MLTYNQCCQTTPDAGGQTLEAKAKILASKPSFRPKFGSQFRGKCYEAKYGQYDLKELTPLLVAYNLVILAQREEDSE